MGFALLFLSLTIELFAGGWFCYIYWTFPGRGGIPGPGKTLVETYNDVVAWISVTYRLRTQLSLLTQERLACLFVLIYLALHLLAFLRALYLPLHKWYMLGARKSPSAQEIQRFEEVFGTLRKMRTMILAAPYLRQPPVWRVRDDAQGMRLRYVGPVLIVDRALLFSPQFGPLLAHELAHVNSFDMPVRALYALFPPLHWCLLALCGLPLGGGKLLLYPFWLAYWRSRVYAADEFAARLGQQHALKRALDQLRWQLDGGRATAGGRWL